MDFAGGRYSLKRKIGAGGGGEVWLAHDRLKPGLPVALKRLPTGGRRDLARYLRGEFQLLSTLEHPRLARVHDLGCLRDESGADVLFFTRDFLEGAPLEVTAGGSAPAEALAMAIEILRALRPLHRSGLVHGDLKPGNVIVDASGGVRLIDFALAGTLIQGAESLPTGTLRYMSPEMIEGRVPDGRGDLYALGVMLVELLTGRPPFEGSPADLMRAHLEGQVQLPAGWEPAPAGPSRADLEGLVARLAARDPLRRFPTLDEAEAGLMRVARIEEEDPHARRGCLGGMHARARQRDGVLEIVGRFRSAACEGAGTVVVIGERGGGRTSFLRGLRWELQMRGARTVELDFCREGDARAQARCLASQIVWLARGAGAAVDPDLAGYVEAGAEIEQRRLESMLGATSAGLAREAALVLLVDGLEAAQASTCRLMRVVGGVADPAPCFVATAAEGEESGLPILGAGPREEVRLERLSEQDLASMVRIVLGRDDDRLVQRLREVSGGNQTLAAHYLEMARTSPRLDGVESLSLPERIAGVWRGRLEAVRGSGLRALEALSVHGQPAGREWIARIVGDEDVDRALDSLVRAGLVGIRADGSVALAAQALGPVLGQGMAEERRAELHGTWASVLEETGAPEHLALWHRALLGESRPIAVRAVEATKRLRSLGDLPSAERLLWAVDAGLAGRGAEGIQVRVALADVLCAMDRAEQAVTLLGTLDRREPGVALAMARALSGAGRKEEAASLLAPLADGPADGTETLAARRDLALHRVNLGQLEQALDAADSWIGSLPAGQDAARADLMCTRALALLYEERLDEAAAGAGEALRIARRIHDGKLRTRAHWILAMMHQRRGDLDEAASSYRQAIDICQRTDDTRYLSMLLLNLGTLLHRTGDFEEAIDRYLGAMDYARSAGRVNEALVARTNLGHLFAGIGLTERAGLEAERILAEAARIGSEGLEARAHGLAGEAARQVGRSGEAARAWRAALGIHERLGNRWEAAEVRIELASALAEADPSMAREASVLVEEASSFLEEASSPLLEVRLHLARARIALAGRDVDGALGFARSAVAAARRVPPEWDDFSWQAFHLMAAAYAVQGSDLLRARSLKRAGEALEEASLKIPARFARAFSAMPSRAALLEEMSGLAVSDEPDRPAPDGGWRDTLMRVMELNRRLATTRDPEALVDVILDSAVEFTGAERGLLLLPARSGGLEIASARDFYEGSVPEAHMEFSTSIARQVQASGEPIITVSAMEDERFGGARSVHELKLQSILCLPIKGRRAILGVIYLENRLRRGKFLEGDRDLLAAFSDQIAIAMETARLIEESRAQRSELERLTEDRAQLLERRTRELDEARRDLTMARSRLEGGGVFRGLVGTTDEMRRIFALVERVGESDVPVVITGESGTGKEMVARAIHAGEARRKGPFVAVNCGAVPAELLESELFGHVRGAFTGAVRDKKGMFTVASGGTLLLDEVGDMPAKMQLDLLRVIQEGMVRPVGSEKEHAVDVRVIAASQRPLDRLVQEGRFREDLYYRLRVVDVLIPPLRDRREDIPQLVDHFLVAFALRFATERKTVSRRAIRMLVEGDWPGNVRQLEHALLNAWVLSDGRVLDADDFECLAGAPAASSPGPAAQGARASIEDEERRTILDALRAVRWNKTEAARHLGIPRRTFYRRLRKFGLLK